MKLQKPVNRYLLIRDTENVIRIELRQPTLSEFDRYTDMQRSSKSGAALILIKQCLVQPTGIELDGMLEARPFLKSRLEATLLAMAGGELEIVEGEAEPS